MDAASHAPGLFQETCGHPELWQYLADSPPSSLEEFQTRLHTQAQSVDPLFYVVSDVTTGTMGLIRGMAAYLRAEPKHRSIEIGHILLGPTLQRTAAATEAIYLMIRHAFEDLGYRRCEWKCNASNAPSRRAAERFGFTYEGTFRQHMIVKGENRDTAWFSMLDREWPARKTAFTRWLDPTNFDELGRQKCSLRDCIQSNQ